MSDSGRQPGECRHGERRGRCEWCVKQTGGGMQSEVRKVLESMRGRGNGWDAYWFWNEIDAAERADAARSEEPRNVTFSDVVAVHCVRCGMQISTTEYVVRCNCGTTIMVHRHNRKVDDGLRKATESQPASEPSVTFGESPKATLPAGKPADEHIRAIAAMAVRDAMPDVIDKLACMFGEAGFSAVANAFRKHAAKLRKERGA